MKQVIPLLALCIFTITSQAQDTIITLSGQEIPAKVEEITLTKILYRLPDSLEASIKFISRQEVFMVKFANGTRELIQPEPDVLKDVESVPLTPQEMAELGKREARLYYKGNGALWGSAGSFFVLPIVGSAIIAAVPPTIKPNQVSNTAYLHDPYYKAAYRKQAHKKKAGKAALGGVIGLSAFTYFIFNSMRQM